MPIYEPGLEELVVQSSRRGCLSFATDLPQTVRGGADVLFIVVDTPQGDDGSADLPSVGAVARVVGRALAEPGTGRAKRMRPLVVIKSTVPVDSGNYGSMLIQEGASEKSSSENGVSVDY